MIELHGISKNWRIEHQIDIMRKDFADKRG
jgi:hypothetical protein